MREQGWGGIQILRVRGEEETKREYKNRGEWRCGSEERWRRKKGETFCSLCF